MQKRLFSLHDTSGSSLSRDEHWLHLSNAVVEVSSEESQCPIENALSLTAEESQGWRAGEPGKQVVRIVFDQPQRLARIQLGFEERTVSRSQEFALAWCGADGARRELLRQQWNFSPEGSCVEEEDFRFEIEGVKVLELTIDPDRGAGQARASLQRLRLA
jgi:hypothetical protein